MASVLITHINTLYGTHPTGTRLVKGQAMSHLPCMEDAYLLIENGLIKDFGSMAQAPQRADEIIDATGKSVLPAWCDPHTHLVFAAPREAEFVDKINGLSYEEIARRGGGILQSAERLNQTTEEQLYQSALLRLQQIQAMGTGAVEIKSGYGLTLEGELKILRVIQRLKQSSPLTIKATFLGAHAYPTAYRNNHEGYLKLLIDEMLPAIAAEKLADYIDVFCEDGYFTVAETERLLEAGAKYGLIPKVHVNQFNILGGVAACVKHNALSVDHLEQLNDADIAALKNTATMPVALPGCSLFLRIPYTPGRTIINAGLPLALATDYNPGSSPSGNMNLVLSLACINMRITPQEAVNAATLNAAYAMGEENQVGSIAPGKKANLIITQPIPSLAYLPYSFGNNLIDRVLINGR